MYQDTLLDYKIDELMSELDNLPAGSVERSRAVSDLVNLLNIRLNRKKDQDQYEGRLLEEADAAREKETKVKSERKDRIIKVSLTILEICGPLILYAIFMAKGFKFEESGTYTSGTFRNLINKLGVRKK